MVWEIVINLLYNHHFQIVPASHISPVWPTCTLEQPDFHCCWLSVRKCGNVQMHVTSYQQHRVRGVYLPVQYISSILPYLLFQLSSSIASRCSVSEGESRGGVSGGAGVGAVQRITPSPDVQGPRFRPVTSSLPEMPPSTTVNRRPPTCCFCWCCSCTRLLFIVSFLCLNGGVAHQLEWVVFFIEWHLLWIFIILEVWSL